MNTGNREHASTAPAGHTPVVSVVIPTYNRASLIQHAIHSCLSQRAAPPLEVIVVDDCSTDDTQSTVARFSKHAVRYIGLPTNRGGAAARNAGIEAARGTFLAFLDSDDTWQPDKLRMQIDAITASTDPANTVCHTQVRAHGLAREQCLPLRGKHSQEGMAEYLFMSHGHIQTSTLLVPTALAKRTRFDPALRKHQDYDFCLRLEDKGAVFLFLPHPLVDWHHDARGDRITRRYGLDASQHFLDTRRGRLGPAASAAFWTDQVFLRELQRSPGRALTTLGRNLVHGPLPLSWHLRWLQHGLGRRLRRLRPAGGQPGTAFSAH